MVGTRRTVLLVDGKREEEKDRPCLGSVQREKGTERKEPMLEREAGKGRGL